jgi:broad specificity phosphatase PhoE
VTKFVELRRHTDNDGDVLTSDGITAALAIGANLQGPYELVITSGAQRATQTTACFLAAMAQAVPSGVKVDTGFRSEIEDRWFAAAKEAAGKSIEDFRRADRELVDSESERFGSALRRVFDSIPEGARALVIGHSPMHEAAVYGLTGEVIAPLGKGGGVLVVAEESGYRVEPLG